MRIEPLSGAGGEVEAIAASARAEGFAFLARLPVDWRAGANRFDEVGEVLLGIRLRAELVAVGGLNRDRFSPDGAVGRLRHLYVVPDRRREGIGARLVQALLAEARTHFATVRLRTDNPAAAAFYERLGFTPVSDPDATPTLTLMASPPS